MVQLIYISSLNTSKLVVLQKYKPYGFSLLLTVLFLDLRNDSIKTR